MPDTYFEYTKIKGKSPKLVQEPEEKTLSTPFVTAIAIVGVVAIFVIVFFVATSQQQAAGITGLAGSKTCIDEEDSPTIRGEVRTIDIYSISRADYCLEDTRFVYDLDCAPNGELTKKLLECEVGTSCKNGACT